MILHAYVARYWSGTFKRWAIMIHSDNNVTIVDIGDRELDEPDWKGYTKT